MRFPNGYGNVLKLSGNRRKPYAVRVSYYEKEEGKPPKIKRKYIGYFSDQKKALECLAEYNSGHIIKEHEKYSTTPTFIELYERWEKYKRSLKNGLSESTWKNYRIAANQFAAIHHKKIINIRPMELQEIISASQTKSRSTVGNMRIVLSNMWRYALLNEITDKDITQGLIYEYTNSSTPLHTRFSDKEVSMLWENLGIVNNIDIVLIYIYTGVRPTELLEMKSENVHLKERYMIGGIKTDAGKDRIIPIHEAIVPLIKARLDQKRPYLITNKYGNHYSRDAYHNNNFNTVMGHMRMSHMPHDTRYTFAALADQVGMNPICEKIIMGHALPNKEGSAYKTADPFDTTFGTYTEKTIKQLIEEVNKLPIIFDV